MELKSGTLHGCTMLFIMRHISSTSKKILSWLLNTNLCNRHGISAYKFCSERSWTTQAVFTSLGCPSWLNSMDPLVKTTHTLLEGNIEMSLKLTGNFLFLLTSNLSAWRCYTGYCAKISIYHWAFFAQLWPPWKMCPLMQ